MDSFYSMKSKLSPLGLYALSGDTEVEKELRIFAAGLDPLLEELELMEREAFVQTAESYGLSERERFIDLEKPTLPMEKRRALLLSAEQIFGYQCSVSGYVRYLKAMGLEQIEIDEMPKRKTLNIYISDRLSEGMTKLAAEKILKAAPPHIVVTAYFRDGVEFIN